MTIKSNLSTEAGIEALKLGVYAAALISDLFERQLLIEAEIDPEIDRADFCAVVANVFRRQLEQTCGGF